MLTMVLAFITGALNRFRHCELATVIDTDFRQEDIHTPEVDFSNLH